MVHFTPEDFAVLETEIAKLKKHVVEIKRQIGESCQGGAETFHDNFEFEEAQRQLPLWEGRLKHLQRVRDGAKLVTTSAEGSRAGIGSLVTVYDELLAEEYSFAIGSFLVMGNHEEVVSLQSPLAKAVRGAVVGETRNCEIDGQLRRLKILTVEQKARS